MNNNNENVRRLKEEALIKIQMIKKIMSLKSHQILNKGRVKYMISGQIILNLRRHLIKKIQQVLIILRTVVRFLRTIVRFLRTIVRPLKTIVRSLRTRVRFLRIRVRSLRRKIDENETEEKRMNEDKVKQKKMNEDKRKKS